MKRGHLHAPQHTRGGRNFLSFGEKVMTAIRLASHGNNLETALRRRVLHLFARARELVPAMRVSVLLPPRRE